MQSNLSPLRNGGNDERTGGFQRGTPTHMEKEAIVAHVHRLMAEAEEFFVHQQQLLKVTYNELSNHVDQLKYRAQFFVSPNDVVASCASSGNRHNFSVPMPLNTLAANAGAAGGFPFGAGMSDGAAFGGSARSQRLRQQSGGNNSNHVSATPLRKATNDTNNNISTASANTMSTNSPHFSVSPLPSRANMGHNGVHQSPNFSTNAFQGSGSNSVHGDGSLGGVGAYTYSTSSVNLGGGTSTPPTTHLNLAKESKSPSLATLLDDNIASRGSPLNDWGSLSLANNTNSSLDNTQSMMASPQFTNTLSLTDLLARFVGAPVNSFDGTTVPDSGDREASKVPISPAVEAVDGALSFDRFYEQLISGEKSRSPDNNSDVNGSGGGFGITSGVPDRLAAMGFAVTSGEAKPPPTDLSAVPRNANHLNSGGLTGGSLFDRNAQPTQQPPHETGDRFHFGSAVSLFSAAAGVQNANSTPTKQRRLPHASSSPLSAATPSQQHRQRPESAASTYALLNSFNAKDVIPIDSIRSLCDHHLTRTVQAIYEQGRPRVVPIPGTEGQKDDPAALGIDVRGSCQVLVEFKRKRVQQYDSDTFVAPGSYVVVGGDRGEDLGLVTYTWCETAKKPGKSADASDSDKSNDVDGRAKTTGSGSAVIGVGLAGSTLTRSIGVGNGTVLRLATEDDVAKLIGVQAELETRAVDVCGQRVLDHALPMVIVDAEYQFDKKKLTFFYEAQQRMDFRDLVRDLYKTFRARIWMELVDA